MEWMVQGVAKHPQKGKREYFSMIQSHLKLFWRWHKQFKATKIIDSQEFRFLLKVKFSLCFSFLPLFEILFDPDEGREGGDLTYEAASLEFLAAKPPNYTLLNIFTQSRHECNVKHSR
jgi:hypothetical protein